MMEVLTQLGVGGIFAIMMVREVLGYLSRRENLPVVDDTTVDFVQITEQIHDLHQWLYVRRSLEDALDKIARSIEVSTETQRISIEILRDLKRDIDGLREAS